MKKRYIALMIFCVLLCSCGLKPHDVVNDTSNSVLEQGTSTEETSSSVATTVNEEDLLETTIISTTREMKTTTAPLPTDQISVPPLVEEDNSWEWNLISDAPYESVITTQTSDEILDDYLFWLMQSWKSAARFEGDIYDAYGIECLRDAGYTEHGNWRTYSIHKLESGAIFYLFYEDAFLRNTVLMTKSLTKADFSEIKIGDSIEKVENIEPATAYWKKIDLKNRELYPDDYGDEDGFTQPLLLKDSLLIIIYEFRDNDYYIEDIVFHDDFTSVYPDFKYALTSEADVYHYAILPEDYPD